MDFRQPSERYADIAAELLENEPLLADLASSRARIAYLSSDHEKRSSGKTIYAQCERVPDKYKWSIPYDFTVTVYEPNVERMTEEQIGVLMLHELLHAGVEVDGNEETYRIIPHDVEDFRVIISRYGLDWANEQT